MARDLPCNRGMELKFAIRSLRSRPGFTLLAIAILALGIGANTAIFSVVNGVLLRPLDYRDPDRIVLIGNSWRTNRKVSMGRISEPDFDDLRAQSTVFDGVSAFMGGGDAGSILVGNSAEFGSVARITEDFFHVMQVDPAMGRLMAHEEFQVGAPNLAVVSDSFWRRRLNGDPKAIGMEIRASGRLCQIIGILPQGFSFPEKTDVWVASIEPRNTSRTAHNWSVIARLKPAVPIEQAQAELDAISARLAAAYPLEDKNKEMHAMGVREQMVTDVKTTLWLLLGSVALVLLIACANVANLLLARATSRQREIAVRAALGAGRWRIIRQLLIESAVIAVAGGLAGLALASWGVDALVRFAPPNLPRLAEVQVDGWVLAFTLLVSLAASVLFGLAPALQASRVDLNDALKQGSRGNTPGGSRRLRGVLVVAEIAISIVLLVGAGLLIRSFDRLTRVELGFRRDHLLVMTTNLPAETKEGARQSNAVFGEVARQIAGIPGVVSASAALGLAGGLPRSNGGYYLEGGPGFEQTGINSAQADFFVIMPDYFKTIGVPFRAGRDFSDRDRYDGDFTVIVNESLVRRSFPGTDPIGRRIKCGLDSPKYMTVIGVVADFRGSDPSLAPKAALYMPYLQHPFFGTRMTFVAHTAADPMAAAEAVRKTVKQVSSTLPIRFTTMDARLSDTVASPRFRGVLLGIFAGLAVILAMVGVYGVMAYMVTQRAGELGLRMALGADRTRIVRMVLANGVKLAGLGLALGFAGAWAATRLLDTLLYGVQRTDPATYAAMATGVGLVTLAACAVPAWRASRVDPVVALRQE
jgi:predicted permease